MTRNDGTPSEVSTATADHRTLTLPIEAAVRRNDGFSRFKPVDHLDGNTNNLLLDNHPDHRASHNAPHPDGDDSRHLWRGD